MTEQEPPDTAAGDAKMYLKAIDFEFFLCLEIATPVFEVTALASDALQNCDIDLSTAYTVVDGVMDSLSNLRTEEQFGKLFKSATEKAEASASPQSPPRTAKAEEEVENRAQGFSCLFPKHMHHEGDIKTLRDNSGQNIFPTLVEMIRTYATIPVSTATVERSFSKLKLVKDTLRSQCTEERLSDLLLLLAIEKDIPVIHSEVINIYRDMAPRRWLL
ncbi:hypothetical protein JOQ06_029035 [Pogonophryne albipinna]|uniref:HAT C-terminal dimerisation domain-containing protein n=1 Tax=Pogonophryne albipinna TaxID=1090488 RepID=A0AAD6B7K7_9TELE|nr:hypothetical protein JOQ06_029035 [Pogonophryne albipinna]